MILTARVIDDSLKEYSNRPCKLGRLVRDGKYNRIIRGLYETDPETKGEYLAQAIYAPSYLSFEYALSKYGLIPEAVFVYTSATFRKRRSKTYHTDFGTFTYRDVPDRAFPHYLRYFSAEDRGYWIAEPEKALCDKIYTIEPMNSRRRMETLLFDDLRIDEERFAELDAGRLTVLSELYGSTNIRLLVQVRERI